TCRRAPAPRPALDPGPAASSVVGPVPAGAPVLRRQGPTGRGTVIGPPRTRGTVRTDPAVLCMATVRLLPRARRTIVGPVIGRRTGIVQHKGIGRLTATVPPRARVRRTATGHPRSDGRAIGPPTGIGPPARRDPPTIEAQAIGHRHAIVRRRGIVPPMATGPPMTGRPRIGGRRLPTVRASARNPRAPAGRRSIDPALPTGRTRPATATTDQAPIGLCPGRRR
ncbi:MAG: hypothetical protein JWN20_2082, partial [Jatrophihabitantaceae bacterium]|nr:hypothetical protein [Jatrophihabitantaceae bacterium]